MASQGYELRCEFGGGEDHVLGICVCGSKGIVTSILDGMLKFWSEDEHHGVFSSKLEKKLSSNLAAPLAWISSNSDLPEGGVAFGDEDLVFLWDLNTDQTPYTLKGHQSRVTSIAFHNEDVISASEDGFLIRWKHGQCVEMWEAHKDLVRAVMVLPTGELVTSSSDNTLKLWSDKNCLQTFEEHSGLAVMSGCKILSAFHDSSLRLWAPNGKLLARLVGHSSTVNSVDSNESGLVASGSNDCSAKIWKDTVCVMSIEHPTCVWDAKFMENGDILTACSDGIVRVWTVIENYAGIPTSFRRKYSVDYVELGRLGRGAYGVVNLCQDVKDGMKYAIKIINYKDLDRVPNRLLREADALLISKHQYVVGYYDFWTEHRVANSPNEGSAFESDPETYRSTDSEKTEPSDHTANSPNEGSAFESDPETYSSTDSEKTEPSDHTANSKNASGYEESEGSDSSSETFSSTNSNNASRQEEMDKPSPVPASLCIRMDYCPGTLDKVLEKEEYTYAVAEEKATNWFNQIVTAVAHMHSKGVIHMDLKPSNIFLDEYSQIKIGDFGEAMVLGAGINQVSCRRTVGSYFYKAPEIKRKATIDYKVDIYSLGVIFFELWHPFRTQSERSLVLGFLKNQGVLPVEWAEKYPEKATFVKHLVSTTPSKRPSSKELLQLVFDD